MTMPPTTRRVGDIVPRTAAPLRTLTAVMAIMCYLAVLAVGAMLLINRAVDSWARGLSSEVTIQVRQVSDRDIEDDLKRAAALAQSTAGVSGVEVLSRASAEKLLEPWLGSTGLDKLPVPRLIRLSVTASSPPDFEALSRELAKAVPTAKLDTHQRWENDLRRMAGTLSLLSGLILLLVSVSSIAMVITASRAVLEANRQVVDVLHLAGADDRFIAASLDRRFLGTGAWAGGLGLGAGLLTFAILGFGAGDANGVASAARGLFYLPQGGLRDMLWLVLVPLAATVIALVTSRLTLMRMLGRQGNDAE